MTDRLQAIRGMNDVLPKTAFGYHLIEETFRDCARGYGYLEFRTPILEATRLFKRSIGEATDIVEKEMYTFTDKNGEQVTLRPEGTASIVRAVIEHGLLREGLQKFWYVGPMFRHEKPQKGRYRQFQQLGLEVFGASGVGAELEMIAFCARFWKKLGLTNHVRLEINTLGTLEERKQYRTLLVEYFEAHQDELDEDSVRRLTRNPLRILDSKNPDMQEVISGAPALMDSLTDESRNHFGSFCDGLDALGISYQINPLLVRGLDYYQHTVFEFVSDSLGSQSTVCAGGRFDGLVEQLGGAPTPAIGLAMGLERLKLLVEVHNEHLLTNPVPLAYILAHDNDALIKAIDCADRLREAIPSAQIEVHTTGGRFKTQFKKADKSGARFALILGEEECASGAISIKDLRKDSTQQSVTMDKIVSLMKTYFEQEM